MTADLKSGRTNILSGDGSLQSRIRVWIVDAILSGKLESGVRLPSSRAMAELLDVSRNTVSIAYLALAADGYIQAKSRSGYFVATQFLRKIQKQRGDQKPSAPQSNLRAKFNLRPLEQPYAPRTKDWRRHPYPFVYASVDDSLFPITAWRDCTRRALSRQYYDAWIDDRHSHDDPLLIDQICQKILIRRGIIAAHDEVLITLGAQNAIYLVGRLLARSEVRVAVENPGYHDARSIFRACGATVVPVPVDSQGLIVDRLGAFDLVYVTPSHQFPSNVTMNMQRRLELLSWAESVDSLIIEDDYEFETNFTGHETPALKALDRTSRVIYVGSLSKSLMPGIRLGYVVANSQIIEELRSIRRISMRHPPGNNQRTVALYLSLGHHDAQLARLHKVYLERWKTMAEQLDRHFPNWTNRATFGGTSFWLKGPETLIADELASRALTRGVVILSGRVYFDSDDPPRNFFRLGFSSIEKAKIPTGIQLLAATFQEMEKEGR